MAYERRRRSRMNSFILNECAYNVLGFPGGSFVQVVVSSQIISPSDLWFILHEDADILSDLTASMDEVRFAFFSPISQFFIRQLCDNSDYIYCLKALVVDVVHIRRSHRTGCTDPDPTNFWESNMEPAQNYVAKFQFTTTWILPSFQARWRPWCGK